MEDKVDQMEFPSDWHKFLDDYAFKDSENIYTNGAYLIPKSRAEQALEHYVNGVYGKAYHAAFDIACDSLLKEINKRRVTAYVDEWTCLDLIRASVKSMKRGK